MENSDSFDIELIERYINGELNSEELNNFEALVKEDPLLADKVNQLRALPAGLQAVEKDRLAKEIKKWMTAENEAEVIIPEEKKTSKQLYFRIISVAAILMLLFFVTGLFDFPFLGSNLGIKAQNFIDQHHQGPLVLRASTDDQWEQAIEHYADDDFDQMIVLMKPIIESGNATAEQYFYFGLAYLYKKPAQYDLALEYLSQTEKKDASTYAEEIAWYRALVFIRDDKNEKAKAELLQIISSKRYGKDAGELLEIIE